jgi:hypothetical protein
MPTLANLFRQYIPIRFGGGPDTVIANVNHAVPAPSFQPVGSQDFLALQVPPREMLLAPILAERSLAMLYAPRGIGKSWLGLTIGLAVASGSSVLRWSAPKPRRVLLVDGEMVLSDLQARLNLILAGLGTAIPNDGFRVLAADHTERGINLGSGDGQPGSPNERKRNTANGVGCGDSAVRSRGWTVLLSSVVLPLRHGSTSRSRLSQIWSPLLLVEFCEPLLAELMVNEHPHWRFAR